MGLNKQFTFIFSIAISFFAMTEAVAYDREELIYNRLNPSLTYSTLETPHFEIHYPEHLINSAYKISSICEGVYQNVSSFFGWKLMEKTHIVLSDQSDQVSLYTLTFPHKQIFFDVSLPPLSLGLNEYADWYEWFLTHEFVHIYQMERKLGFYKGLQKVVGATAQPNMTTPNWLKEGTSVLLETKYTPRGRGDGPFYRMYLRQAVDANDLNEEKIASLDTINTHSSPTWPWTLRSYLMGYYLVRKINTQENRLIKLINEVAESYHLSFEKNFKNITKQSLQEFWTELKVELNVEFKKEIEKIKSKNLTPLTYLTQTGFHKSGLTLSPNGNWLLFTQVLPEKETSIIRLNIEKNPFEKMTKGQQEKFIPEEHILNRSTGSQISFSKSNRFIAFDESSRVHEYYVLTDIAIYDLKEKKYSAVSPSIRARDPDIHPDGKHLVFVLNENGKNRLFSTDTAWSNPVDISGDVGYSRISTPRFNHDGSAIAVMIHNEETGGEDLVLYTEKGLKPLVSNSSLNFSPAWVPGKNQIVFSSDMEDGVFNIYLFDLDTQNLFKLTNVVGGLFNPVISPDGTRLYFVSYNSNGYDIATTTFDMANAEKVDIQKIITSKKFSYLNIEPVEPASKPSRDSISYDGFKYLNPQYITPSLMFLPDTFQLGATVGAVDPLFMHHYELTLRQDSETKNPVGRFYFYDGAKDFSWDIDINKQSYPIKGTNTPYQSIKAQMGLTVPLQSLLRNSFIRPHADLTKINFENETVNFGPGLSLYKDTEFTQWGLSFPERGSYSEIDATYFFPNTKSDLEYASILLKHRQHHQIAGRNVYHISLDASAIITGRNDIRNGLSVGSKLSFPMTWGSDLELFGYPPNYFFAKDAQIISQRLTFEMNYHDKFFSNWIPFYFERMSGSVLAQVSRLAVLNGQKYPWSAGLELYQDFILTHLFPIKGSLGVYQGDPLLGGQTQIILTFEHKM